MIRNNDSNNSLLFTLLPVGKKTAPNRFVAQPMEANDGDGGNVSKRGYERYRELARGNWGIVIVEALSVTKESLARKNGMILNQNTLDSFKKLVDEFKSVNPDALLFFQITHSGNKSGPAFSRKVKVFDHNNVGQMKSGQADDGDILTTEELEEIKALFVNAVLLASEAGADGVDFKLCHGYLGSELLRPSNLRHDKWGRSFENRTRLLREGITEIKSRLTVPEFILGSRISMYEAIRGGCGTGGPDEIIEDLTEMIELIKLMENLGMDYVNVSAGIPGKTSQVTRPEKQSALFYLHQFRYAKKVKEVVENMKVIGSAYSSLRENAADFAEENSTKGYVDFVGFGRQSFADPLYPRKLGESSAESGEEYGTEAGSKAHPEAGKVNYCTLCSGCSKLLVSQAHTGCIVYNPYYKDVFKSLKKNPKAK